MTQHNKVTKIMGQVVIGLSVMGTTPSGGSAKVA